MNIFNNFETLDLLNLDEMMWDSSTVSIRQLVVDNSTHTLISDNITLSIPTVDLVVDNSTHTLISDNITLQSIIVNNDCCISMALGTAPPPPLSGKSVFYCKDDGKFYYKPGGGTEHIIYNQEAGVGLAYQSTDKPDSGVEVSLLLPYSITFESNLSGASYYAAIAPSTTVAVSIKNNGTQFGTLSVTGTTPTFTATQTTCAAGDRISFAFGAQDSTWAGVSVTLKGVRT